MSQHSIKDDSEFVVLQDSVHMAVSMSVLQEQMAPLAIAVDYQDGINGVPGLVYPGDGIQYDSTTGEMSVVIPYTPTYLGKVGSGPDMVQRPTGKELPTHFYVAGEIGYKLDNNWGELEDVVPAIGDQITSGDARLGQDRWFIVPNLAGSESLQTISSITPALEVDSNDKQNIVLSIKNVEPYVDISNPGLDGLMPADAFETFNNTEKLYLKRRFDSYPNISSAVSSTLPPD